MATTRYDIRDVDGSLQAVHVRPPNKKFRWVGSDGSSGLAGRPASSLPLYGSEKLRDWPQDAPVVITEGEKDAQALMGADIPALGTVTGASSCPNAEVLAVLKGRTVILWPDNDDVGEQHMVRISEHLESIAAEVRWVELPRDVPKGWDAASAIEEGRDVPELVASSKPPHEPQATPSGRWLRATRASDIAVRPVKWTWEDRLPVGEVSLLGGREGIGKSGEATWLAAQVTRGRLPGEYLGTPSDVLIVATEDSWAHTIVPRLMAHGADLDRVHRIEAVTSDGLVPLSMPQDLGALEGVIGEVDAALVIFDPFLSRLDARLDTHKDAEVRLALEPLRDIAERTGAAFLGLIHVNKSQSTDPLTLLMGSRAFAAVARAVLFMIEDPDDPDRRLLGQAKSNLGRLDLPTLKLRIKSVKVADTDEGEVWTGKVVLDGESELTIRDAVSAAGDGAEVRTAVAEAADWLMDFLKGGPQAYGEVKRSARKVGHSESTLQRASKRLHAIKESAGYPRQTFWSLPDAQSSHVTSGESEMTGLTGMTDVTGSSHVSGVSHAGPPAREAT